MCWCVYGTPPGPADVAVLHAVRAAALPLPLPLQGLFLAPQTTGEAIKGGRLVAEVRARFGGAGGGRGAGGPWLALAAEAAEEV